MRIMSISRIVTLFCLVLLSLSVYPQYIDVTFSSTTVCPGEPVTITNNSDGAEDHDWLWSFCKADPNEPPNGDQVYNYDDLLTQPTYLALNKDQGIYYTFINNYAIDPGNNQSVGKIVRYTWGAGLQGVPTDYIDLNISGMPKNLEGLQIIHDTLGTQKWYGFIVGGQKGYNGSSFLARLDFGTNLNNPNPTLVPLIDIYNGDSDLDFPHDLYVFYNEDNAQWHGLTVNKGNGTVTRFDFDNGIENAPTLVNLGNFDGLLEEPVGIFPIREWVGADYNWYVFITDRILGLRRLNFGDDLLNPTPDCSVVPLNTALPIEHPRDISLFKSCDDIYGYIVSGESSSESNLVRLRFFDGIDQTPEADLLGTLGNTILFGHSISDVFRVDDDYYAMTCNISSINNGFDPNATRVILPSCEAVNYPIYEGPYPPIIIYDESGPKQIEVISDFGTPQQENECYDIFVEYLPALADTIQGPLVVCPGDTVIYFTDILPYTDEDGYNWVLPVNITEVEGQGSSTITVAISETITPGDHTLEIYGTNHCGDGPVYQMDIHVDTSTVINTHPVEILSVDVSDNAMFGVTAAGTNLNYQWQESTDGGTTWFDLIESYIYVGVNMDHLTIRDVLADMSGYKYRCLVTGTCAPMEIYSGDCILVVGALLTTVGNSGAEACPNMDVDIPVQIAGFSEVSDFSLSLNYSSDLTYLGFSSVHQRLTGLTVTNPTPGELLISWSSDIAQTILSGKMVALQFHTEIGAVGDFTFNEGSCVYHSSASTELDDDYIDYDFTILPLPDKPQLPTGTLMRCEGSELTSYEVPVPSNTNSYTWVLNPLTAGTVNGTSNPVEVAWDEYFNGEAWIKVKGENGCGDGIYSDSVRVVTNPLPLKAVVPVGDTNLCEAGPDMQYFTNGASYSESFLWYLNPPEAGSISGTSNTCNVTWNPEFVGMSEITVKAVNTCGESREQSEPIYVDVNPLPEINPFVSDSVAYLDAPVTFDAEVWRGTEPYLYNWDFMSPSWYAPSADTTIVPDDPYHEYVLTVVDSNNCVMTSTVSVKILLPLFVPNAFTPNQNGLNDHFRAFITGNVEGVKYRMFIYSREGTQVYSDQGNIASMVGWDGTFHGEPCPTGVYVYYLYFEILGYDGIEGEQLLKGTLTLLK